MPLTLEGTAVVVNSYSTLQEAKAVPETRGGRELSCCAPKPEAWSQPHASACAGKKIFPKRLQGISTGVP